MTEGEAPGAAGSPVRFPWRATLLIVLVFAIAVGATLGWKPLLLSYWLAELRDGNPSAPWELSALGPSCAPALIEIVEDGGPSTRWRLAAEALGHLEDRGAVEAGSAHGLSPAGRARYAIARGGLGGAAGVIVQRSFLGPGGTIQITPGSPEQLEADDEMVPALIEMLGDPEPDVAKSARTVLVKAVGVDLLASEWPAFWERWGDAPPEERKLRGLEIQLARDADSAWLLNNLAWTLVTAEATRLHDPERSLELSKRAVDLTQGNDANVIDTYAEALFRCGRADDAIAEIERAIALKPERRYFRDQRDRFLRAKGGEAVGPPVETPD